MNSRTRKLFLRFAIVSVFATIMILGVAVNTSATIMKFLEVEDLTAASTHVFRGQVLSSQVFWTPDHQNIYTATRIQIDESFKGGLAQGQIITIKQLGGEIDGIGLEYDGRPTFRDGESVFLFTNRSTKDGFVVTGLKQGKMRVEGDTVIRDFSGMVLIDKNSSGKNLIPVSNPKVRFSMDEIRTRVIRTR